MSLGYEALRHGAAWLDLSARGRIVVRGRDRARLLHAITSNEVKKMTPGTGCYAFLLNPQGRIQADLCLFCFDDHFLLDTEPELREKVHLHIKRYIIADQVELEDVTAGTAAIGVEGPGAAAILTALGAPVPAERLRARGVGGCDGGGGDGDRAAGRADLLSGGEVRARWCINWRRRGRWRRVRRMRGWCAIENGKPRYGEDIRETSLPQETQQMHAVSFNKGCYLGQEIVERIRAQGRVNKKLMRVVLEGVEAPAAGTKTTVDGAEAEVTSAVVSPASGEVVALAYVRQR